MPIVGTIVDPIFKPAVREIIAITNAPRASVTTSFAHGYLTGLIVRLYIPHYFGMEQADRLKGSIEVTSPTTFIIDINTTSFDPFAVPTYIPPNAPYEIAQVVPIGEVTETLTSSFRNILKPLY